MDFDRVMQQLEEAAACMTGSQVASRESRNAAEKVFLDFRALNGALPLCRYILERCTNPYVQFVACQTVKEAMGREWTQLEVKDVAAMEEFMLQYLVCHTDVQPYVRQELIQAIAVMLKRGWVENEALRNMALRQMGEMMAGDVTMKTYGGLLMIGLLNEFSSGTKSSEVGLTWEFHDQSKKYFETNDLKGIFHTALGIGSFNITGSTLLRPGVAWRDILVNQQVAHKLVQNDERLVSHTLQCIVQLASLDGKVFADPPMRISYITWVMEEVLSYVDHVVSTEQQIRPNLAWGMAETINRMVTRCTMHPDTNVYEVLPRQLETLLDKMCSLACYCLTQIPSECDQTWYAEAFDQLLDAWESFSRDPRFPLGVADRYVSQIFKSYLQSKLKTEEMCEDDDGDVFEEEDDETTYSDQLISMACIVRWCPQATLPILHDLLCNLLVAINGKDPEQVMPLFGGIHWLLLVASHVLADGAKGEQAMVPAELNSLSAYATQHSQTDYVLEISNLVFMYLAYENTLLAEQHQDRLSPLVATTLMCFVGRWCQTYLFPEPSDYQKLAPALQNSYGRGSELGVQVLERVLQKVYINLSSWPFELQLATESVKTLMKVSKNPAVRAIIHQSQAFELLRRICFLDQRVATSLQSGTLRGLAHACLGLAEGNKLAFVCCEKDILNVVAQQLESVLLAPTFASQAQEGHMITTISRLLDLICGIMQAAVKSNSSVLFNFIQRVSAHLLSLIQIYHNCPEVVLLVVEIYVVQAEHNMLYLADSKALTVYNNCMDLLKLYSAYNLGKTRRGDQGEEEQYEDLLLFLRLLTNLLSRDILEFGYSGPGQDNTVKSADVVLYGLTIIMPLMTEKIFNYPNLCSHYYKLVSFLSEVYPEKVATLDPTLLQSISYSLNIGLASYPHYVGNITDLCLDAIEALAKHAAEQTHSGQPLPEAFDAAMQMLMRRLFETCLSEGFDFTMLCHTAEALFPFVYSRQAEFQGLCQQIVSSQQDAALQERANTAIVNLLSANGLVLAAGRKNMTLFSRNLH
eukprot:Ihof_evm3s151 gene=Ihof_evmTU3s151